MFENLTGRLSQLIKTVRGEARLTEDNIQAALREVRLALLEADVALPVVKDFVTQVRERALGQEVMNSLTPGQALIGVVHRELITLMGETNAALNLATTPPAIILMAGLQGSGKTTTSGKLAKMLREQSKKKVLLVSCDVYRPAAIEQLKLLAQQTETDFFPSAVGQQPMDIARGALEFARTHFHDVLIVDTAGRLAIDAQMMEEIRALHQMLNPIETLFVVDSMQGQDAVNVAKIFDERVGLTGIVLTRIDGDARGGAALSMRAVTGKPIKLLGVGEKVDDLEDFDPQRIAGRILGMGDIVALVEKAAQNFDAEKAAKMAERMRKGKFDLEDMAEQLAQVEKIGGIGGIMGMLPGMAKIKDQMAAANIDEKMIKRQRAIILSMTPEERRNPDVLKASRKRRIAAGSGTRPEDVNRVLKQHRNMADMMKAMGGAGGKRGGMMGKLGQMMGMGGGMNMPSPEQLAEMQKQMGGGGGLPKLPEAPPPGLLGPKPGGLPGLPGLGGPKLPGLGGGFPGGFNPFGKKK